MEIYTFVHGSSVGQSTYIPMGFPIDLCQNICNRYFNGRDARIRKSSADTALFIEICNSEKSYVCYSYVRNKCFGAGDGQGREGQYFAISILSDSYVYPELVYSLLNSAYEQMFVGKIIDRNNKYIVNQLNDKSDILNNAIQQINNFFEKFPQYKQLKGNEKVADYNSFDGEKLNIETCNSELAYDKLCKIGRIYISKEYESPSVVIRSQENKINELNNTIAQLNAQIKSINNASNEKNNRKLEDLNGKLRDAEARNNKLESENRRYQDSIDAVRKEIDRYGKINKPIEGLSNESEKKGKKDMLKLLLLIIILIFSVISSILSFAFFRGCTPYSGEAPKNKGKIVEEQPIEQQPVGDVENEEQTQEEHESIVNNLSVNPPSLEFEANGGTKEITITGEWVQPDVPQGAKTWLTLKKKDANTLSVSVKQNTTNADRKSKFFIENFQISITQKGVVSNTNKEQNVGLSAKDSSGKAKSNQSEVKNGDIIKLSVSNPVSDYSWYADGAALSNKTNTSASATITVTGGTVTVSYGPANQAERQKMNNNKVTFKVSKTESPKSISASQTNLQFAADGGMQEITINAIGGEWSAIASGQGITANRDGNNLKVQVGPNTSEQQRSGIVTCSIVGASNTCTINITQEGRKATADTTKTAQ